MSEQLVGVLIGGAIGVIGALLGNILIVWAENRRETRERLSKTRLRLVGSLIQTSEAMEYIASQRKREWPSFWRKGRADLSRANLEEAELILVVLICFALI